MLRTYCTALYWTICPELCIKNMRCVRRACTPHFLLKKKTGRARSKRKPSAPKCHRHLGEKRGPSESVQPEIGALVPSAPYSGHQPTASPHNRCDTKSEWSSKGLSADSRAFRFATRCRMRTGQRQRKEKQGHTTTTPSRFGCRLRGPIYGAEALRRTRQEANDFRRQCLRRPPYLRTGGCTFRIRRFVPASFLLTGRSRFLFNASKRKWGRILPGSPVLPAGGRPK